MRRCRSNQARAAALVLGSCLVMPTAIRCTSAAETTTAPGLEDVLLQKVQDNLATVSNSTDAWVKGTQVEALIELHYPELSVFSDKTPDLADYSSDQVKEVVSAIGDLITTIPAGQMQMISSASSGDPCSLVPAIDMLASFKDGSEDQSAAVQRQIDAILSAPRSSDGAISHRVEIVQLWADFMYMVPPSLAYYGVNHKNESMVEMAIEQTLLYQDALSTDEGWRHIVLGEWQDIGLWATGNAWAAAGALRVYAAIHRSDDYADQYADKLEEVKQVTADVLDAAWSKSKALTGLLPNYFNGLDDDEETSMFSDASSTALLAATTYRFAQLGLGEAHLDKAESARQAIQHAIDDDGWLGNVADPETWMDLTDRSPEAQAFVLLLQAAWKAWKDESGAEVQDSQEKRVHRFRFARDIAFEIES